MGSADVIPYHNRLDWLCNEVLYVASCLSLMRQFLLTASHSNLKNQIDNL